MNFVIAQATSTWPLCEIRCPLPAPKAGYAALPATTGNKLVGQKVTFSCETAGETVGYTLSADLELTCGPNGTYPEASTWEDCAVKCPVPEPGSTFSAQVDEKSELVVLHFLLIRIELYCTIYHSKK